MRAQFPRNVRPRNVPPLRRTGQPSALPRCLESGEGARATSHEASETPDPGAWRKRALEQALELGPLQTPLRCVVIKLQDGSLWVHAPLAPTEEFFELVESIGNGRVAHVIAPTSFDFLV